MASSLADITGPPTVWATHDVLAVELGSAREVVSRLLKSFEDDGELVALGRGSVRLLDVPGLRLRPHRG